MGNSRTEGTETWRGSLKLAAWTKWGDALVGEYATGESYPSVERQFNSRGDGKVQKTGLRSRAGRLKSPGLARGVNH